MSTREVAEPAGTETEGAWLRLDPRVVRAFGAWCALVIVAAAAVMWWRGAPWWLHASVPVPVLGALGYERLRWHRTHYRLTPERIEVRTGVLVRSHRFVSRERVRSVDITAEPMHRVFGIATVRVGTGHRAGSPDDATLTLDALAAGDAASLREELLGRVRGGEEGTHAYDTLARIDWRWLRFAVLSASVPLLGGAAVGGLYNLLDLVGAQPDTVLIPRLWDWLSTADPLPVVVLSALALLLVGAIGSLGLYAEMWWGFRLVREPGGALRVTRGLVVTRSVTLEEERLRGVELAEPLLLRGGGGAYTYAVATGTGTAEEEAGSADRSALLPPAPLGEAHRVTAEVLREEVCPTVSVRLVPHTRHALVRRLRLAFLMGALVAGVPVGLGVWLAEVPLLHVGWVSALAVWAVGALFAVNAFRALGHGITGRYLVTRHGSLKRRTIALRRDGVIGWKVTRWAWHRRSGLSRVTATTAGGRGAYHVKDVLLPEGLRFAEGATPGLLRQFLVRRPAE
ncbi:hypothetical protein GCM10010145_24130 [Streptomyces ruber]|uniref:YdbS-like PH domain-containing protein n=2 Tax=Streptomyces TaxID=1883 RepID=A0A918BAQ6_9ACTN|nr:PH domain-containing protein [Streptomyces ruber]GGQ53893.1 hypothetical protein GCM10010145_24130 [Streptomyces ruber]